MLHGPINNWRGLYLVGDNIVASKYLIFYSFKKQATWRKKLWHISLLIVLWWIAFGPLYYNAYCIIGFPPVHICTVLQTKQQVCRSVTQSSPNPQSLQLTPVFKQREWKEKHASALVCSFGLHNFMSTLCWYLWLKYGL